MSVRYGIVGVDWLREHYDDAACPSNLIDTIGFKMACLSSGFEDPYAIVAADGQDVLGILPVVRCADTTEILGQFYGEGYRLNVPDELWTDMVGRVEGPVHFRFSSYQHPMMKAEPEEGSFLALPAKNHVKAYEAMFTDSDSRRHLKHAQEWESKVTFDMRTDPCSEDFQMLYKFSIERLGEKSRYNRPGHVEAFEKVVSFLRKRYALGVNRYMVAGELIAIAFMMKDFKTNRLTFLSGFASAEVNNFGKYIYWSFVKQAEAWGFREVSACSPLYRIKKDMRFVGRTLYGFAR